MRHTPTTIAIALLLVGASAQAAVLNFACPVNPTPGTKVTLGPIVTNTSWSVQSNPTGTPATVVAYQHPAWIAPVDGGQWLSIQEQSTPTNVNFVFTAGDTINVNPSVVDVASITATTKVAADNYLDYFVVTPASGSAVNLPSSGSFGAISTHIYPDSATPPLPAPGFQAGSNQIGFSIRNAEASQGGGGTPMGLFASVTLTATCLPTPPGPVDDTYPMAPGQTSLSDNVGSNDTLPGTPEWSLLTPPPASTGNLVFNPDGSFTFTPAPGFSGPVDFSYRLCSGPNATAPCAPAKVLITVPPALVSPSPVNDSFNVTPGQALNGSVVGNDQNVPATPEWSLVTPPPAADGTLVFKPDGTFTFTPAIGFTGPTTFTYQLCSGPNQTAPCAPATVTLSLAGSVAPVPGLGAWALLGLTAMLAGLGVRRHRAA